LDPVSPIRNASKTAEALGLAVPPTHYVIE
jgi:hypothetical protein